MFLNRSSDEQDLEVAAFSAVQEDELDFSQLSGNYHFGYLSHAAQDQPWAWVRSGDLPVAGGALRVKGFLEPALQDGVLFVRNPYFPEEVLAFRLTPEGAPITEEVLGRMYPGGKGLEFQDLNVQLSSYDSSQLTFLS